MTLDGGAEHEKRRSRDGEKDDFASERGTAEYLKSLLGVAVKTIALFFWGFLFSNCEFKFLKILFRGF